MTYRDDLLPGALNGIGFDYKDVTTEVGRRGVVHEFAGGDSPFTEDLGRAARHYTIRAFLIGPNYHVTRDELQDVVEGPGPLVFGHPYKGDIPVRIITRSRFVETDEEGGMVTVDLSLEESGDAIQNIYVATPAVIKVLAADAMAKLAEKTKFSLLGAIGAVLKSVTGAIEDAGSAVRKVNGKIGGSLSLIDNLASSLDELAAELTTLMGQPQQLINKLGNLVDSAFNLIKTFAPAPSPLGVKEEFFDLVSISRESIAELFSFESEAETIPTPTKQSNIEHQAHDAISVSMKGAALSSGVAVLADLDLESADQAKAIVGDLVAMFLEVMNADIDPEVADAFAALKAATISHFTATAQALPQLSTYTPIYTVPAVVLAYELYGDAGMDEDLIRRNKIRHPAFVMGGRTLEVLADD